MGSNSFVTVTSISVPSPIVIWSALNVEEIRFTPATVRTTSRKSTTVPVANVGPETTVPSESSSTIVHGPVRPDVEYSTSKIVPSGTNEAPEPDNNFCSENVPVFNVKGLVTVTGIFVPLPIVIEAVEGSNTGVLQLTPPNEGASSVKVTVAPVGMPEITVGVAPATRVTATEGAPSTL